GDGINTIQWIFSGWTSRGLDPSAAGATDVQYEKGADGKWVIVEADIYLNAENHRWVASGTPPTGLRDLASVLTHEMGHLLGLLHPCEPGGADGAPDCATDPAFAQATMYPIYDPAEVSLGDDDEAGACFLYPGNACEVAGCPAGMACSTTGC